MSSPNHEDSSNSMAIFCDHEDNGIHMLSNLAEYFATCFDVTLVIHCTDTFDMHFNNAINVISVTSMSDYIETIENIRLSSFEAAFFLMFWPNELSDIVHHSKSKYIFGAFMEDDKRTYVKKVCDAFVSFSKEGYKIYDNTHDLKYYAKVSPNEVISYVMTCNNFMPLYSGNDDDSFAIPDYYCNNMTKINNYFYSMMKHVRVKCIIIIYKSKTGALMYNTLYPHGYVMKTKSVDIDTIANIYMKTGITGVLVIGDTRNNAKSPKTISMPFSYNNSRFMIKRTCIDKNTVCYDKNTVIDYYKVQVATESDSLELETEAAKYDNMADKVFFTLAENAFYPKPMCFKYSACGPSKQEIEDYIAAGSTVYGIVSYGNTHNDNNAPRLLDDSNKIIHLDFYDNAAKPTSYWLDMGFSVTKVDSGHVFIIVRPEHFIHELPDVKECMERAAKKIIDNETYDMNAFSEMTGLSEEKILALENESNGNKNTVKTYMDIDGLFVSCTVTCFRKK